jgi:CheY-like chemotaxis protein
MSDAPCALIVDDEQNTLGDVALRLLRLRIDLFYAKEPGEAWLLAQQEADRIRSILFPPGVPIEEITRILESLDQATPDVPHTLVVMGERPGEAMRDQLRAAGVDRALWEPFDESALRSVVSDSMVPPNLTEPRREVRLPTTLLGRAFIGAKRKDAIVSTLSMNGAFLEIPSPFPEGSRISLEIALPEGSVNLRAQVVNARYPSSEAAGCSPCGMGVEFLNLDGVARQRLRAYLKEIAERFCV